MLLGFGLFLMPVAGPPIVLGPLGGLIAGTIGGAGVGALISGLMALGLDREQALKHQTRQQAGEFLVTVTDTHDATTAKQLAALGGSPIGNRLRPDLPRSSMPQEGVSV